ncbi:hypothetical protein CROQUDRAFT_95303 [Cronartium quercuum f. sp. fusiforme G11]|uniref:Uncharacterized protein n=1 Tax=Cronartium quercuum f. sp. fusiforme G11 TaxID=708437 RepID=A0A9P6NCJ2_9BASI|nr:hypothetical protein CROQUDRAFT_95303 [Cronartium quercuum f. sp. fusiforme G11]
MSTRRQTRNTTSAISSKTKKQATRSTDVKPTVLSNPVNGELGSSDESLLNFAVNSSMARDITAQIKHREANRNRLKPKPFRPPPRFIEEEDELNPEEVRARAWRPKEGRPPEHMSAATANLQRKYNPLINLLGVKLKIVKADDEELEKDEDNESTPEKFNQVDISIREKQPEPRVTMVRSRKRVASEDLDETLIRSSKRKGHRDKPEKDVSRFRTNNCLPGPHSFSPDQDIGSLDLGNGYSLTSKINRFLRAYQRDGVKFLFKHYSAGNGAILADDMGLGKTIQVISFLAAIMGKTETPFTSFLVQLLTITYPLLSGKTGTSQDEDYRRKKVNRGKKTYKPTDLGPTCLVICPNSVVDNWAREIETWGYFEFGILNSSKDTAHTLKRFKAGAYDILICGFEYARNKIDDIFDLDLSLVVDEAHRLKNWKSETNRALHRFRTKIRFGLTGTALQNNLAELHSVFDWARPFALGTRYMWKAFVTDPILHARKANASKYEIRLGSERARALVNNCWPDLQLRRTKAEILKELPSKTDHIVMCPMTVAQQTAYKNLLETEDVVNMRKHAEPSNVFHSACVVIKIANHLALLYPNREDGEEKFEKDTEFMKKMFPNDYKERQHHYSSDFDTELCGKWLILKPLLKRWKKESAKVLIFSQWTKMMDILSYWLEHDFPGLDGKVPACERLSRVDSFQTDPNKFIFLVSTLAGGVGLNLTAANKVVIFDPSWNPASDEQAMNRVVRIGQQRSVECLRLIGVGTAEELVYQRQIYKTHLAEVANTAQQPVRKFMGVQGDKKNQGEIWGVKNIFRLPSGKVGDQEIDGGTASEVLLAMNCLATKGAPENEDVSPGEIVIKRIHIPQEDIIIPSDSTEEILRSCGVGGVLPNGEVGDLPQDSEASGAEDIRVEKNIASPMKTMNDRSRSSCVERLTVPLRKPAQVTVYEKTGDDVRAQESVSESESESGIYTDVKRVAFLQKKCNKASKRLVDLDAVLKNSRFKTKEELAFTFLSWRLKKREKFLSSIRDHPKLF